MKEAASWVYQKDPNSNLYLWVLSQNYPSIRFYERLGGNNEEEVIDDLPGGGQGAIIRFVWTNLQQLINS